MPSWIQNVEAAGKKVEDVFETALDFEKNAVTIFDDLSAPTVATASAVFYDAVQAVQAGEGAAADAATGNVGGTITLSKTTLALIQKLVADFKAGKATVEADFDKLGIKL